MSTTGKKWTRKDKKWTDEIIEWVKSVCPLREHGFNNRQELTNEINRRFNRDFTIRAVCSHCCDCKINLGLCHSNSVIPHGEKHWRHRPIGAIQEKKGYLRIKVAEPNVWMQYQRYIWEQHHPGESAEGKRIIFMDGNTRNFEPTNLECVTPGEQAIMAVLGCRVTSTRQEREIFLLRARIMTEKTKIVGGSANAQHLHQKIYNQKYNQIQSVKAHKAEYARQRREQIKSDPVKYAEELERQRAYREKNRNRINAWATQRRHKIKETDPERYRKMLEDNRNRTKRKKLDD